MFFEKFDRIRGKINASSAHLKGIDQAMGSLCYSFSKEFLPRYADEKCLVKHGYKVCSQNDEDGIIDHIFRRIGRESSYFVEFGIGWGGLQNNTLHLLMNGWSGLWFEGNAEWAAVTEEGFGPLIDAGRINVSQAYVDRENFESLLEKAGVPAEFDLLSIDIDGNDYWVWAALERYRPRSVVIEYQPAFGPVADWKMKYGPHSVWNGGTQSFGASLKALELLGRQKGYSLVGCNITGANAFFVRDDLVGDHFLAPFTSEFHHESFKPYITFPDFFRVDHDKVLNAFLPREESHNGRCQASVAATHSAHCR